MNAFWRGFIKEAQKNGLNELQIHNCIKYANMGGQATSQIPALGAQAMPSVPGNTGMPQQGQPLPLPYAKKQQSPIAPVPPAIRPQFI